MSFLLLCAFACSRAVTIAQTTGDIEGTVTDNSGAPLPGVTVVATSPSMQGSRVTNSDRQGRYRLLTVPPGNYRVKASLDGFETIEDAVTVSLDATATLDLKLGLIVREAITVSGEVPMVDVTSTTAGTNYTSEVIAKLPVQRNYADIVRANPGVNTDNGGTQGRSLALTVYGATSLESQWIIDGVNTTNVIRGFQGKAINNEFIDEVEVKTGGYQAEYGRALGGVINVITKSGGNEFHGDAFIYYDSEDTRAERIITSEDEIGGMRITPEHRADYGADIGGFLLKDRLWFFAAYDRIDTPGSTSRYFSSRLVLNTMEFPLDTTDSLYSGKVTWNASRNSNVVATAFSDPSWIEGAARGNVISNPDPATWESVRKIGGLDLGLRANQLVGSRAVVTVQASRHRDRFELFASGPANAVRLADITCEGGTPEQPCNSDVTNFVTGGLGLINGPNQRNGAKRNQYRVDTAFYSSRHETKLGGDYQRATTRATSSYTGGQRVWRANEFGQTYYSHDFFAKSPSDLTPGDNINEPHSSDIGLYLQDSWRPAPNWTVNLGLRWDQQTMSNHGGETVFKTSAQWQPRIGLVWDPDGHGRSKLYAFAGRFYYSLPTALSIFSYGSTTSVTTYNFDPVDRTHDPAVFGHERAFVSVTGFGEPVDSGLKASYQDELTVGVEKLLDPSLSLGLKGTYRRLGRIVEDRCDLDYTAPENTGFSCAIMNPGSGGKYSRGDFPACNGLDGEFYACQQGAAPAVPARRVYRGIELLARKSLRERFWLQASYVYSSLRGNSDGFVNESYGGSNPGINVDYNYPQFQHNSYGRLYLDRPHSFRLDASYTAPFRMFAGLQGWIQSGAPLDRFGYFNGGYGAILRLVPRGSAKRLRALWEANLTAGYPLSLGPVTVTLQAYAFNLFNNQIETSEDIAYSGPTPGYPENLFDQPDSPTNPNYGKTLGRQQPRLIRGAVKIAF
jgi:outer membrane receptor protein involved in Fe transport